MGRRVIGPWLMRAACRGMDPELFHPHRGDGRGVLYAKDVCAECPVRPECLDHALSAPEHLGVWGGTTEKQRRRLRAQRAAQARTGRPRYYRRRCACGCDQLFRPLNSRHLYATPECATRADRRRARQRMARRQREIA